MNIKKIIAREGLIVLSIVLAGVVIGVLFPHRDASNLRLLTGVSTVRCGRIGRLIILYGYPICLIIRFIFWGFRTLKEK